MQLRYRDPLTSLMDIQRAFDSVWESPFFGNSISARGAYPPINLFEGNEGKGVIVVTEIPGTRKDQIKVSYQNKTLTIEGEIPSRDRKGAHRIERRSGRFSRRLNLPFRVKPDEIKAEYADGILSIHLVKAEEEMAKSITIQ